MLELSGLVFRLWAVRAGWFGVCAMRVAEVHVEVRLNSKIVPSTPIITTF